MTPPKPEPVDTAEEFACKRIPYIRAAEDENIDLLESVLAGDIRRRDSALVADAEARGARRVLEEIADRADDIHTGSLAGDYWLAFREIVCKYKYTKGGADEQGE